MNAKQPKQSPDSNSHLYSRMEKALLILAENRDSPPSLATLADSCGMSEYHFQRLFTRWVGISPKRFSQFLTKEHVKSLLDQGMKPMDAGYQAGLSGPGRLHDLLVNTEAVTPAEYKRMGSRLTIHHACHDSPFGHYLLGVTDRGICHMEFLNGESRDKVTNLKNAWPLSRLVENPEVTGRYHEKIFDSRRQQTVSLYLKGTNFQIQVWQALLQIPYGQVTSYEALANFAGNPAATRASASAVARNGIAWLIPCHRVIRKLGETGRYRWGANRKKLILGYEAATSRQARNNK